MSDLDSIVKLYTTQQHASELYDRHVAAISTLCRSNAGGFPLQDIFKVVQILDTMLVLISEGNATFVEPACWLIRTLAKPYSRRAATDELKLSGILLQLLETLARYLQLGIPPQLQACTAEMLGEFSSAYNNRPDVETAAGPSVTADLQSVQRMYLTHQRLLAESKIAQVVCAALQSAAEGLRQSQQDTDVAGSQAAIRPGSTGSNAAASGETALQSALLLVVLNFSYSKQLSEQLLMSGVLSVLTQLLQEPDNSKTATQVVEVLWNLLELAPQAAQLALAPAIQRPKAAGADAPTASEMQDAQEQTQQQQSESANEPPWDNRTLTDAPTPAADLWVRSASSAGSRPDTGLVDLIQTAARPISAPEMLVSTSGAAGDTSARAATTYSQWPGSAVNTPEVPAAQQQQQQLAYDMVENLGMLLKQQVADTSSRQAKEARNDTLAVLHHLSNVPSWCTAMAASGIMPVLLSAATTPELQPSSQHVPAGALTKDEGDHEMKLLLWATLGNIAANSKEGLASAGTLLRCMLLVVDESDGTSTFAVGRWSPDQLAALRRMAWSVLQQVAPLSRPDYRSCGGVNTLIRHLANSSIEGSIGLSSSSASGSRAAAPGSPSGRTRATTQQGLSPIGTSTSSERSSSSIEPALRLLQRIVAADAAMATAFVDAGVLPVLLQLLQSPIFADVESVRVGVLLVLAELCGAAGSSCRDQLRQNDGVGLLLRECKDILTYISSTPSLAGLSALDCLWRCCIPSSRCRAQFLALDGMDLLLGLLLDGSKYLRPVTLSILADLLADRRSHPFFMEWHSPLPTASTPATIGTSVAGTPNSPSRAPRPDVINAVQLLLSIWREQDQARGLTGPDGVLANPSRPLAGLGERTKWRLSDMDGSGGYGRLQGDRKLHLEKIQAASTRDTLMDKIFACISELGFEAVSAGLSPSDAAVLAFIRQYVKFRQGEVWQDIKAEFEAAGLTPTQEDGLRVISGIQHSELLAHQVADAQRLLLSSVTQEQLAAERATYEAMLAQAVADAKARVYEKDSSKLTMRERLAAKARKEEMLKHSLANSLTSATAAATGSLSAGSAAPGSLSGRGTPIVDR